MTLVLALAIWVGVSAIAAPVIGHFLFALQAAYPASQPALAHPRQVARRGFARRRSVVSSWARRPLAQSKFG